MKKEAFSSPISMPTNRMETILLFACKVVWSRTGIFLFAERSADHLRCVMDCGRPSGKYSLLSPHTTSLMPGLEATTLLSLSKHEHVLHTVLLQSKEPEAMLSHAAGTADAGGGAQETSQAVLEVSQLVPGNPL